MANQYSVELSHPENADIVTWEGEAEDTGHAADLAREAYEGYDIDSVVVLDASNARFPDIEVELEQDAGDAFMIISRVRSALRLARQPKEIVDEFTAEAMEAHPSRVLDIVNEWVTVK